MKKPEVAGTMPEEPLLLECVSIVLKAEIDHRCIIASQNSDIQLGTLLPSTQFDIGSNGMIWFRQQILQFESRVTELPSTCYATLVRNDSLISSAA